MIPLVLLAELVAHEHQLLAGVRIHEAVERPQRRRLLPVIPGNLAEHRPLAVHDLVVRKRQDEVLVERVEHRERQVAMVPLAVDGVGFDVLQDVVHPPHVPLVGETQAANPGRPADRRPRRRLFRNRDRPRRFGVRLGVEVADEINRLEVFPSAESVGHPLAVVSRVVEVEHRGHGIHTQPVGVVLLQPEEGVREQKAADLGAPVVEDQRSPIAMLALPRVGVLEERRAVEPGEAVRVLGEMARHPVENDANLLLMAGVDKRLELRRRAEAARRREKTRDLIPPGRRVRDAP